MQHKISDLTKLVSTMYDRSIQLHRLKYDTPKDQRDESLIQHLICDIQQMACLIYHDKERYPEKGD